mgnify:CR=1 FL=1
MIIPELLAPAGDRERLDEILKLAHTEDVKNDTED